MYSCFGDALPLAREKNNACTSEFRAEITMIVAYNIYMSSDEFQPWVQELRELGPFADKRLQHSSQKG